MLSDLDDWGGTDRFHFDAQLSGVDLFSYHLPMHESCVREAGALSMMCGYNSVNGVPSCANPYFEQTIARDEFGLEGWITSQPSTATAMPRTAPLRRAAASC